MLCYESISAARDKMDDHDHVAAYTLCPDRNLIFWPRRLDRSDNMPRGNPGETPQLNIHAIVRKM